MLQGCGTPPVFGARSLVTSQLAHSGRPGLYMQGKLQSLVQDPGAAMVLFLMSCMAAASLLRDPSSNSWMICEHVGGLSMFRSMGGLGWGWEGDGEGYLVQGATLCRIPF